MTGPADPGLRVPPHSVEAEQSVLGGLLIDPAAWERVEGTLSAADFYSHEHAAIFDAVAVLARNAQPADVLTVFEQLRSSGAADDVGGLAYLNSLAQSVPSAANVRRYAELVRERATLRRLIGLADNLAARAFSPEGDDAAALAAETAECLLTAAGPPASRFEVLTPERLEGLPPMQWIVPRWLPRHGLGAIYGPSGSGKTFAALSLLPAFAEGGTWMGQPVRGGHRVAYLGLEGTAGVQGRVRAWAEYHGRPFPDAVGFVLCHFNLTDLREVRELIAAVRAAGGADVLVLDTLNAASGGVDENGAEGMGAILSGARVIAQQLACLVLLVHHSGKTLAAGLRGHSSLHAALDVAIEVTREGDRRELRLAKSKDGQDGLTVPFMLERVEIGTDEDGEPITSCVAVPTEVDDQAPTTRAPVPRGGNQRIALDALAPLFRESNAFGRAGAPQTRPCIELEAAISGIGPRLPVEAKRRRERAQGAITGLVAAGSLISSEGWLWLP